MRQAKWVLLACLSATGAMPLFAQNREKRSMTTKTASTKPPATREVVLGKKLFEERCAICHFSNSEVKKIGPGMKGIYQRGQDADGKAINDASLRAWIEKGGKNMPGFKDSLKEEEIRALIAYLKTL